MVRRLLRQQYQQRDFREVPSFLRGEASTPLDAVSFQLVVRLELGAQPGEWVERPVNGLRELFKRRKLRVGQEEQNIKSVLVTGDAGAGKSTLLRKLAFDWARGFFGQEFAAVFILLIRNLQQVRYNNQGDCFSEETLATAITRECFPGDREESAFCSLRELVG